MIPSRKANRCGALVTIRRDRPLLSPASCHPAATQTGAMIGARMSKYPTIGFFESFIGNAGDDEDQYQRERQFSDPKAYMRLWVRLRDMGHTRRTSPGLGQRSNTSASAADAQEQAPEVLMKIIKSTCIPKTPSLMTSLAYRRRALPSYMNVISFGRVCRRAAAHRIESRRPRSRPMARLRWQHPPRRFQTRGEPN